MNRKFTTESFIEKAKLIHGNVYDYSKTIYLSYTKKVEVYCTHCKKYFFVTPANHLCKRGCPYCKKIRLSEKNRKSQDAFINEAIKLHGNKYDYSEVVYVNNRTPVKIKCKKCGKYFLSIPSNHLAGKGCKKCATSNTSLKLRLSLENFLKRAKMIHGDMYDYSEVELDGVEKPVKIFCKKHKIIFYQSPCHHYNGSGCPMCNIPSIGEKHIAKYLTENKIKFVQQKTFKECKDKALLKFDFYLPGSNTCIEYQGKQHYEIVDKFGGKEAFKIRKKHDNIKRKYCKKHNVVLVEIKYTDNIKEKLKKFKII